MAKEFLQRYLEELEEDLNITPTNLEKKVFSHAQLHAKYSKYFIRESIKLNRLEEELKKIYREKYHYYSLEFDKDLTTKEVEFHILSDEEYAPKFKKVSDQKVLVNVLEKSLKKVDALSYDIKNAIDYVKFMAGV